MIEITIITLSKKVGNDVNQLLEQFLEYLRTDKKVSTNTLVSYEQDLRQFGIFLVDENLWDFSLITEDIIQKFLNILGKKGKSPATLSRMLVSIRSIFSYLVKEELIEQNPAHFIHQPKIKRKPPEILSEDEVIILLKQPDSSNPKGMRDKAMLELMYATGVTVSELLNLCFDDLDFKETTICCRAGEKERILPVHERTIIYLEIYLKKSRSVLLAQKESNIFFLNCQGKPMTRQGFWKIVKQYGEKAGIGNDLTPATIRNSFAAHLSQHGANLHRIQELMGHSRMSSTQIYTQLDH